MKPGSTLTVLALLEATSISGTAKAVLEMAYEAQADQDRQPKIQVVAALFHRGKGVPDDALTKALKAADIPVEVIREKGRFDRSVVPQIEDAIAKHKVGVVWTNSVKSHFLVKSIPAELRGKWVAYHHGYTATDFKMRLYNQLDRWSLPQADEVVTVCQPFAAELKGLGVRGSRLQVQHMPIRNWTVPVDDGLKLRNELGLPEGAPVILTIGRLSQEKGQCDLIQAFEQLGHDRAYLVLVGDGPERGRLESLAWQSAVSERILFTGHRDDAKRFYRLAAVFALPSYSEGTPNVLLEAMAAQAPIAATRVGGVPELIADKVNGLLVPAKRPAELAGALQKLIASVDLRNELSSAAREVVAAHTPRMYFENMRQVFVKAAAA